jgi:DnaJ-domain-containing protein 1
MSEASERRRKARVKPVRNPHQVTLLNVPGSAGEIQAKLLDMNEVGLGVETDCLLEINAIVIVKGQLGPDGAISKARARVVRCDAIPGGYRTGLALETGPGQNGKSGEAVPDYYEVLQISPNADPDMIHRVYRLLAQRYHPDNTASGDERAFRAITDAYETLSEPEKRAAYDVHLHAYRQVRWRIFDQRQAAIGKVAEKSKRRGLLELLYTQRCNEPEKPSMNLHELEDLLGCPREHLEFSLWYLKENGLVLRMDNGRFAVTAKGVDWAEQEEASERLREDRLLPAASGDQTSQ